MPAAAPTKYQGLTLLDGAFYYINRRKSNALFKSKLQGYLEAVIIPDSSSIEIVGAGASLHLAPLIHSRLFTSNL